MAHVKYRPAKKSGQDIHLLTPATAEEQNDMLANQTIDLIYANPFDTASLVRDKGYRALVKPTNMPNEMVIATSAEAAFDGVEGLTAGCRIAITNNRDVRLVGIRLLEPADLTEADVNWVEVETYQAAARMAIKGEVDASFFWSSVYHFAIGSDQVKA